MQRNTFTYKVLVKKIMPILTIMAVAEIVKALSFNLAVYNGLETLKVGNRAYSF